jgi:hypothetical protein
MGAIEQKILDILKESVEYEVVGGPTPSETLKAPLDYAKNVQKATVPQTTPIPGVGETGEDEADDNDPITDVVDEITEDEGDEDGDEDDEKDKDDLGETFASLLARLAEDDEDDKDKDDLDEDEESLKGDNGGTPDETLPDVDSKLDSPDDLVTKAPGVKVAEDEGDEDEDEDKKEVKESKRTGKKLKESKKGARKLKEDEESLKGDNGGTPKETLPGDDIDSLVDSPDKLVTKAPGSPVAEDEDDDEDDKDKEDVSEDINAIFTGTGLSETAKSKAATIFKAAVARRVNEERQRVQKIATKKLKEAFAILKTQSTKKQQVYESKLTKQVDGYLNYVVENWMETNRLAVERGIRAELSESFIRDLKKVFVEHYIEVPESKVDVVATLGKKVTKLEAKLNESVNTNVKMRSALSAYRKEEVIRAVSGGLADTQAEKLRKLAEGVEYTTRKEFAEKVTALKESYFAKAATPRKEEPLARPKQTISEEMETYSKTLAKFKKN